LKVTAIPLFLFLLPFKNATIAKAMADLSNGYKLAICNTKLGTPETTAKWMGADCCKTIYDCVILKSRERFSVVIS